MALVEDPPAVPLLLPPGSMGEPPTDESVVSPMVGVESHPTPSSRAAYSLDSLIAGWNEDHIQSTSVDVHDPSVALIDPTINMDIWSWPWLHEKAFLPCDPRPEGFAMTNLFPDIIAEPKVLAEGAYMQECQPGGEMLITSFEENLGSSLNNEHVHQSAAAPIPTGLSTPVEETQSVRYQKIDQMLAFSGQEGHAASGQRRIAFWSSMSPVIASTFAMIARFHPDSCDPPNVFRECEKLYFDHFYRLWPLISRQSRDPSHLHPYLYLTIVSIGAMYGDTSFNDFGTMLHKSLCKRLVNPVELCLDDADGSDFLWLAQSRLLMQVTTLYFGQTKAFTYAQHLGMLLISQARKMNLFSGSYCRKRNTQFMLARRESHSDDELLSLWLDGQARRWLAFGIFRGDAFLSILLNTRPLISLDEIDIEFPYCEVAWASPKMRARQALDIIEHDRTPSKHIIASDIHRILVDRDELLPPLEPLAHELSLFGLQEHLWRFSHDDNLLERLTGHQNFAEFWDSPSDRSKDSRKRKHGSAAPETSSLDVVTRQMLDLITECDRLKSALLKWERALQAVKSFSRTDQDRNFVLSSLILYHIGYMRLLAPIEVVHQLQYQANTKQAPDQTQVLTVMAWANSPQARLAIRRVDSLCSLLAREARVPIEKRCKVNLLAFIGLHHASALLWAYFSCSRTSNEPPGRMMGLRFGMDPHSRDTDAEDEQEECPSLQTVLQHIIDLCRSLNPAGWSTFVDATRMLTTKEFPLPGTTI